jgi:predicted N-acetyltransferase YhbS
VTRIVIRDYTEADAPSVGRLIADTYRQYNLDFLPAGEQGPFLGPFEHAHSPDPAHQAAVAQVIRSEWVYVAEQVSDLGDAETGAEIVGVLRGRAERLGSLFVRGDCQRQGIGRALVEHFERVSRAQGVRVIRVAATLYGLPFYLAMGYKRSTGVRNSWSFQGHGLPIQPMRKVLSSVPFEGHHPLYTSNPRVLASWRPCVEFFQWSRCMKATFRPYHPGQDEPSVSAFLERTCPPTTRLPNWPRPRWEYMIYAIHGGDKQVLAPFGLWHAGGQLVGVAHFEDGPGQAFLQVDPGHADLKPDMLAYAERALSRDEGGRKVLTLYVNAFDRDLEQLARASGYVRAADRPEVTSQVDVDAPPPEIVLPAGFRLTDRAQNNDLAAINRVLWRGFNHQGPAPERYVAGRADVERAPLYRPELTLMVQAPDGALVSYCGIWYVPANRLAVVEPVATDPEVRRRGLARAAVLEGIHRASRLGATRAIVGSGQAFYRALGFRPIYTTYPWHKEWSFCSS